MAGNGHGLRSDRSNWREVASRLAPCWLSELRGPARAIGGSLLDGDDLLAEAIEGLMRAWERGAGPDYGFRGYLVRSMRNRLLDEARSPRSRSVPYGEELDALRFDVGSAVERRLERVEDRRLLHRSLSALPEAVCEILIDACVLERKPAELAVEWGVKPNTAAQRVARAKRLLRSSYLAMLAEAARDAEERPAVAVR